jgi:hypothetical protein
MHVIYQGTDGNLHELLFDGEAWTDADLSASAPASQLPAGDPAVAVWDSDHGGASEHVFYLGTDGHLHELYSFQGGSTWQAQDLTWITHDGATPAGNPAAFVWEPDPPNDGSSSLHVAYRGVDGGIHEYQRQGEAWTVADLTAITNTSSAPASGDPVGVAWNSQPGESTIHWYYRASDGFIRELWRGSGSWSCNDLSTTSTGPAEPAQGEIAAYVWDDDPQYGSSIHVTYRGEDEHLHDLWFREWEWTADDITTPAAAPGGQVG